MAVNPSEFLLVWLYRFLPVHIQLNKSFIKKYKKATVKISMAIFCSGSFSGILLK